MNYGLPYMGSKNRIAQALIDVMPKAHTFVDLFCGGCAVTHAAMLSGKYKNFIANDIDGDMPRLFLDCIDGKFKDEKRWISREDFEREMMPLLKAICGPRLGENPNEPTHPLYKWKA